MVNGPWGPVNLIDDEETEESLNESDTDNFDSELVIDEIRNQLTDALKKKYKNLDIDFDDKYDDGSYFRVNIILYNKGEFLADGYFSVNYNKSFNLAGDISSFVNKIKYKIKHPDYEIEKFCEYRQNKYNLYIFF